MFISSSPYKINSFLLFLGRLFCFRLLFGLRLIATFRHLLFAVQGAITGTRLFQIIINQGANLVARGLRPSQLETIEIGHSGSLKKNV